MENKNDIGKAFRQKLDGLHRQAPDNGWASLSGELKQKKAQRAFSWRGFSALVMLLIIITAGATYSLWEDDIPHVYIEMPDEHDNNSTVTSDTIRHDNATAQPERERIETETVTSSQNAPASKAPVNTEDTAGNNTAQETPTTMAKQELQAGNPAGNSISAAPENVPEKITTPAQPATANSSDTTGTVKMLDLSKVDYGSKDLNLKKEKKLDTRRIADSLNKLYGKEKPANKKKKQ